MMLPIFDDRPTSSFFIADELLLDIIRQQHYLQLDVNLGKNFPGFYGDISEMAETISIPLLYYHRDFTSDDDDDGKLLVVLNLMA